MSEASSGVLPISERITLNIMETLNGVTTDAGYGCTLWPERHKATGNKARNMLAVVQEGPDAKSAESPIQFTDWDRPYAVDVYVVESETHGAPWGQLASIARADIERAVMADPYRGGWALNTTIEDPELFVTDSEVPGVSVRFTVRYRHLETDPYLKTNPREE